MNDPLANHDHLCAGAVQTEVTEASPPLPTFSIVILTRNRGHFLPRTLEVVFEHVGPSREVLLFDNGSTDNTAAVAREFPVRYFFTPELGLAEMRQRGLEESRGEFVVMCDDDCLPQAGWLDHFARSFDETPALALIGGKIINIGFNGKAEKGIGRFGRNGQIILGVPPAQASYFGCANLALRKRAVLPAPGFDPFLISGYEEGDLASSLLMLGQCVSYEPRAVVEHHNIAATQRTRWRWRHAGVMRIYFFLKHFRPRGLAWLDFLAWECWLQLRTFWKGSAPAWPQRLLAVIATFCALPGVIVRSGRARRQLLVVHDCSRANAQTVE